MSGTLLATALRTITRPHHRGYAVAVVLTLALGIGAVTAIWCLVHAVLLAPLPFAEPQQVLRLVEQQRARGLDDFAVSRPNFESWRAADSGFAALAALRGQGVNLADGAAPERVNALAASANVWDVLGLSLRLGRAFAESEERSGGVAILGEGLWQRRYGADPAILGRTIRVDGVSRIVVGVAPQDLGFAADIDLWLPLEPHPSDADRGDRRLFVLGRLQAGTTAAQAQARLDTLAAALDAQFPGSNRGWTVYAQPARDWIVGSGYRQRLQLVLAAVGLILLLACSNVANLQLARTATRLRELGVRQALGASRARLLRELLAENLVLVLAGSALGLGLAALALQAAGSVLPGDTPRLAGIGLRPDAALAAILACALVALAFGLLPAMAAARSQATAALQRGRGPLDQRRAGLRRGLVVAQFALAMVLSIGALQLLQQWLQLARTPLGFDPQRVWVGELSQPEVRDAASLERQQAAYGSLLREVADLPGVVATAIVNEVPQGAVNTQMRIQRAQDDGLDAGTDASWRVVSADYFEVLRIPLLAGRGFAGDAESPDSVLLGEGVATALWGNPTAALGRGVRLGNGQYREVVGVVADLRQRDVADAPTPTMYFPTSWWLWPTMHLMVRAEGDPAALAPALRAAAARAFPDQALHDLRPLQHVVGANIATPRLQATLVLAFATAGLLLAALGIAGVVAYLVAQRNQELAVRMALGAAPRRVLRQVMAGGIALCALGAGLGLLLAAAAALALQGVVRDAGAGALLSVLASVAVLAAVGVAATWLPARRVLRISPSAALRGD